jgi:hypothetical protein
LKLATDSGLLTAENRSSTIPASWLLCFSQSITRKEERPVVKRSYTHDEGQFEDTIILSDHLRLIWLGHPSTLCTNSFWSINHLFSMNGEMNATSQRDFAEMSQTARSIGCMPCTSVITRMANTFQSKRPIEDVSRIEYAILYDTYARNLERFPVFEIEKSLPVDFETLLRIRTGLSKPKHQDRTYASYRSK